MDADDEENDHNAAAAAWAASKRSTHAFLEMEGEAPQDVAVSVVVGKLAPLLWFCFSRLMSPRHAEKIWFPPPP